LLVTLVDFEFIGNSGDKIIARLIPYFPTMPAMLICIQENGFVAHAHFQTPRLLALLQLETLRFDEIDISVPPPQDLPF
jgi:hypothetical protein